MYSSTLKSWGKNSSMYDKTHYSHVQRTSMSFKEEEERRRGRRVVYSERTCKVCMSAAIKTATVSKDKYYYYNKKPPNPLWLFL